MAKPKKTAKTMGAEIDDVLSAIRAKYGEGAIMKLGDAQRVDVDVIPTGSLGLDAALGGGDLRPRIFGQDNLGSPCRC